MTLKRLSITCIRNLLNVEIIPSPQLNLIFGNNGSGKTSILEAIHVLALGRSFRSHKYKPLVTHDQSLFTVFGKVSADGAEVPIGITRPIHGESTFRVNGANAVSVASLATYLPLQVINSDTFLLLEGSPKIRRQFLDWLVFHVEPSFFPLWKDAQLCLKHRNSLLRRDRIDRFELATWDHKLIQLTEEIHSLRDACVARFSVELADLLRDFSAIEDIEVRYSRGWDRHQSYTDILAANFERDQQQGFTQSGIHRADIKIRVNGQDAAEVLSRGQQKILVCALKVAQGRVFSQITQRRCIYLIDDLPAELDSEYRALLVKWLYSMNTQIFITGVEREALLASWKEKENLEIKLFHVEQGVVNSIVDFDHVSK